MLILENFDICSDPYVTYIHIISYIYNKNYACCIPLTYLEKIKYIYIINIYIYVVFILVIY